MIRLTPPIMKRLLSFFSAAVILTVSSCSNEPDKTPVTETDITPESVVQKWNNAHNDHNTTVLDSIYADEVDYYHTILRKKDVLDKKKNYSYNFV